MKPSLRSRAGADWALALPACTAGLGPAVLQKQPWRRGANELMTQARSYAYFPFPGAADIAAAMNEALDPLLNGQQGPDAAMQEMKLQVQNVMDQYR